MHSAALLSGLVTDSRPDVIVRCVSAFSSVGASIPSEADALASRPVYMAEQNKTTHASRHDLRAG